MLWHRLAAATLIRPLVRELPCAAAVALKKMFRVLLLLFNIFFLPHLAFFCSLDSDHINIRLLDTVPQLVEALSHVLNIFFSLGFSLVNFYGPVYKFTNAFFCGIQSATQPIFFSSDIAFSSSKIFISFFFRVFISLLLFAITVRIYTQSINLCL